jgi:uncharacterized protein with FMN-binding domain
MNPLFSIYKKIGIVLGILVLGSVGGVTIVKERKAAVPNPTLATAASLNAAQSSQTPAAPSPVKVTPKITYSANTLKPSQTNYRSSEEESEGGEGGDDDGGSYRRTTSSTPAPAHTPTPVTTTSTPPPATTPKNYTSVYKDGTYTAIGSYMSPGGPDQISITLTLKNDVITAISATSMAGDGTSKRYQDMFISGYKQYVVGQNIANVNLMNVSGSSLTPIGFNDAISQIMSQAKA